VKASESRSASGGSPQAAPERPSSAVSLALLNRAGVIVSVNQAWTDFARDNGGDPARTGVGSSYLDVCAKAGGDPVADQVADAIGSALHGGLPAPRSLRIPCHAPGQQRWFNELISSRYTDEGECVGATITLSPSAREPRPHRTTDEMLEHAVSRLQDAQSLLDALSHRLSAEVDKLTLTATFENLDAVIRDLRPRPHWRHH
jgi:hypothetical protein